jgi:Fe-S cluster biogenesis protein NfuA
MAQDLGFQKQIQRIAELVELLEKSADPSSRATAKELLESMMALHGAALDRMLEIAAEAGETGNSLIGKFGQDELVSSVLLLYGLHPLDLKSRVAQSLEKKRSYLESHAASAHLVSISEDGTVLLRLEMKANGGCGSSADAVRSAVEGAIQDAAPDAASIVIEEAGSLTRTGFVPLAQLSNAQAAFDLTALRAQRSGD